LLSGYELGGWGRWEEGCMGWGGWEEDASKGRRKQEMSPAAHFKWLLT